MGFPVYMDDAKEGMMSVGNYDNFTPTVDDYYQRGETHLLFDGDR